VAIVKLDIQGSEPEALKGAMTLLRTHRPIIVIEVVESWPRAPEVESILHDLGYVVHALTREGELVPVHDARAFVSWDWIAVPLGISGCSGELAASPAGISSDYKREGT